MNSLFKSIWMNFHPFSKKYLLLGTTAFLFTLQSCSEEEYLEGERAYPFDIEWVNNAQEDSISVYLDGEKLISDNNNFRTLQESGEMEIYSNDDQLLAKSEVKITPPKLFVYTPSGMEPRIIYSPQKPGNTLPEGKTLIRLMNLAPEILGTEPVDVELKQLLTLKTIGPFIFYTYLPQTQIVKNVGVEFPAEATEISYVFLEEMETDPYSPKKIAYYATFKNSATQQPILKADGTLYEAAVVLEQTAIQYLYYNEEDLTQVAVGFDGKRINSGIFMTNTEGWFVYKNLFAD